MISRCKCVCLGSLYFATERIVFRGLSVNLFLMFTLAQKSRVSMEESEYT